VTSGDLSPRIISAADPQAVAAAVTMLRARGLVAMPTETVYGLACALDALALDRLLEAKHRPRSKGITLLVDGLAQAEPFAVVPPAARALEDRFWPGPLTIVLAVRPGAVLPDAVTGGTGAVGIRVPDHAVPRGVARELGPLPTTSANLSGQPDALSAGDVVAALGGSVGLVVDGGPSPGGVPSTVISLSGQGEFRLLRPGALPYPLVVEAVVAALGQSARRSNPGT
jgi:L-threonylcarbamoyladenylate synthase